MPGIFGYIAAPGRPPELFADRLATMQSVLLHRDTYETQTWTGDGAGLGVVWLRGGPERRLSVADGGGRAGVLGGYVYSGAEGAADPLADIVAGSGRPDPRMLDGSYHAAVFDGRDETAWFWADELGYRHLYYYQDEDGLLFAPEAKAILAVKGAACSLDHDTICDYLNYGYALGDRTYHREIKLLRPGRMLSYRSGQLAEHRPYGDFAFAEEAGDDPAPYIAEVNEIYPDLLQRMTRGYDQVLVTLTGGLDSRFVLGQARRAGITPRCFTHGQRWCNEYKLAGKVAAACGAPHDLVEIDPRWFPQRAVEFVRLTEGQCNLRPGMLLAIGEQFGMPPTETCFLNGIFGGPVNFGSGYFNARDLQGYDGDEQRELDMMLRSLFTVNLDSPSWNCYQPEYRQLVRRRRAESVVEEMAEHRGAGPHFYQQKDSFFIHNRLFRMMNAVDVNRYQWHDHFALVDGRLLDLSKRLPAHLKLGRRFFVEYFKQEFPDLSRIPYQATGVDLYSQPSSLSRKRRAVRNKISRVLERGSQGRIRIYDPQKYLHYEQWVRKYDSLRQFFRSVLLDPAVERRGILDRSYLEAALARQERGVDQGWMLIKLLSLVIYLEQVLGERP